MHICLHLSYGVFLPAEKYVHSLKTSTCTRSNICLWGFILLTETCLLGQVVLATWLWKSVCSSPMFHPVLSHLSGITDPAGMDMSGHAQGSLACHVDCVASETNPLSQHAHCYKEHSRERWHCYNTFIFWLSHLSGITDPAGLDMSGHAQGSLACHVDCVASETNPLSQHAHCYKEHSMTLLQHIHILAVPVSTSVSMSTWKSLYWPDHKP
jgi:hypothetical protein